jgi:hypothetical protein
MTKTATVHAQQRWEYMEITRKTEGFLVADLNKLGEAGWELISVNYYKAAKSGLGEAWSWTAFLKRPHAHQSLKAATQQQTAAAADPEAAHKPAKLEPGGSSDGFDFAT